ncbi:MAG: GGDEF domain-containing protein [Candidatus Omnitrophica bacterium]|nr:GGDEF domain-containing protein [Candidatus Omnitrophota bacterium]
MIPKLKQRLSKYYLLLVASLLVPLAGFFVYATRYQNSFFAALVIALAINVVILFMFYRRQKRKRSSVKLQREEYFEKANILKADLQHEWEVITAFRKKIVSYSELKGLVDKLSASLSLEDTAHTLCRETARLFDHHDSTFILYLFDPIAGELAVVASERNQRAVQIKAKQGDVFDRWVMKTLQPLYLEDTKNDFRFDGDGVSEQETRAVRSLVSVPLMVHENPVGIFRMSSPVPGQFTKEDLRFLKAIGDVAAVAVENAHLYDKVEDLAIRDSLTGLYLRRHLMERMGEEVTRHLRREREMSFVMIDLDYFKRYNDQFGHTAGDIVLKQIAALIEKHFKAPGNFLCRYGGEEFCVVLSECSKAEAQTMVEGFRRDVEATEIILRREKTRITVSSGIATFPKDARAKEDLIQKADEALYAAKRSGRNKVCVV